MHTFTILFHNESGSISTQPGSGLTSSTVAVALPTTRPKLYRPKCRHLSHVALYCAMCMGSVASRPKIRSKSSQVAVEKCLWDGKSIFKLSPKDLVVVKYTKNFRYILWKKLVHFALPGNRKVYAKILGQIYFVQEVTLYDKLRFLSLIWPNFFSHFGRVPAGIWQQCWTLRIRILYTVFFTHMHTLFWLSIFLLALCTDASE